MEPLKEFLIGLVFLIPFAIILSRLEARNRLPKSLRQFYPKKDEEGED